MATILKKLVPAGTKIPSPAGKTLVRKPEPGKPVPQKPAIEKGPDYDTEPKFKSVSVRLDDEHRSMVDRVMRIVDCDKSQVVKRGIKLQNFAYAAQDAELIIIGKDGIRRSMPLMKNGQPCL